MDTLKAEFIDQCIFRLEEYLIKINACFDELTEEEIWQRPNESSNSIGNIILHLCGNISQYIISSLGKEPDTRERDKEFSVQGGVSKEELQQKIAGTVSDAIGVIRKATEEDLLRLNNVQGFNLSGLGIILHVTEHFSYHTGQVLFWTKLLKNKRFDFYKGHDLNVKNTL